jgi:hypothetical protein
MYVLKAASKWAVLKVAGLSGIQAKSRRHALDGLQLALASAASPKHKLADTHVNALT